jgi:hypothetical protein
VRRPVTGRGLPDPVEAYTGVVSVRPTLTDHPLVLAVPPKFGRNR